MRIGVIGAMAALAVTASARAEPNRCVPIADLTAPALFARFPAPPLPSNHWRAPDVRRGEAHDFRTALREGGRGTPNFAGNWTIVHIGCGAGAVCPAFVDRSTGRVRFDPALRAVVSMDLDFNGTVPAFGILTYRRDSRLMVALGAPNERKALSGANLFDWHGGRLQPIRFVPERDLYGAPQ